MVLLSSPASSPEIPEFELDSDALLSFSRTCLVGEGDREVTTVVGWRLCREGCSTEHTLGLLYIEISAVVGVLVLRKTSRDS